MLEIILTIFAFLTALYLEIGVILGLVVIIYNPTGEPRMTDRLLLGYFYILCWAIIWIDEGELF